MIHEQMNLYSAVTSYGSHCTKTVTYTYPQYAVIVSNWQTGSWLCAEQ